MSILIVFVITIERKNAWGSDGSDRRNRVTIIAADFSIHVSVTDSRKRQKISETVHSSNNTINSFEVIGIYIFPSTMEAQQWILLLDLYGT